MFEISKNICSFDTKYDISKEEIFKENTLLVNIDCRFFKGKYIHVLRGGEFLFDVFFFFISSSFNYILSRVKNR
jgi:hypothetical protein